MTGQSTRAHGLLAGVAVALTAAGLVAAGLVPVPVLVLSLPFLVLLARRPVLRRLALRNASRRPKETALVLMGALLGTAIITGSAIVGDTLTASIRRSARTQLGPTDVVVQATGLEAAAAVRARVAPLADDPLVDGMVSVTSVSAAVAGAGEERKAEPHANVHEVDFAEAARFGGDAGATGIAGDTPTGENAVVGEDLAATLDAEQGDRISVFAYGQERSFTIERVLPRLGVAGLNFGFGSESPNVFVPLGTIASLASSPGAAAQPPTVRLLVSAEGGVMDAAEEHSSELVAKLERSLQAEPVVPATVDPVKERLLEAAEANGKQLTELFQSLGVFTAFAGVLLLVNIFVMLAQERKTEMGMLRAVGMRRSALVGSFSLEGWMYALASAALGTVAGLGVGRLIVVVAADIFSQEPESFELRYSASLATVQSGFVVGFVISLLTVLATSVWVSRLNVIRAIRDLPEPTTVKRRLTSQVIGAGAVLLGGLATMSGFANDAAALLLVGPTLIALGGIPLLSLVLPRRATVTVLCTALIVWAILAFDVVSSAFKNPDISLFVVDGIILVVAAIALASQNQEFLGRIVRRIAGGSGAMAARLGLAYPLARRGRTGMILAMYAVVVFSLTGITLFSKVFEKQVDNFTADVSGGFHVKVWANETNPIPATELAAVEGVEEVSQVAIAGAEFMNPATQEFVRWPLAGYDQSLVDRGAPALEEWSPKLGDSEEEAYRAVLADPSLVIVNEFFLVEGGGGPPPAALPIGTKLTVRNTETGITETVEIAALAEAGFDNAFAWRSRAAVERLAGPRAVPVLSYVATSGVDPQDVAERINGAFLANGADAISFERSVARNLEQQQGFMRLMQGYLSLGLVVGIAGLGVVMTRAVRERRRQIGVLRALGFQPSAVRRAFLIESSFVTVEGIVIGGGLSVLTTWRLMSSGAFGNGLEFSVPWISLGLILGLTFVTSLVATVAPAQQASRIRPAVALRIAD